MSGLILLQVLAWNNLDVPTKQAFGDGVTAAEKKRDPRAENRRFSLDSQIMHRQ